MPDHIPASPTIAETFLLFDRQFCSVHSPANPNRACITSGTTHHDHGYNDDAFLVLALPQMSILQQLSEAGIFRTNIPEQHDRHGVWVASSLPQFIFEDFKGTDGTATG